VWDVYAYYPQNRTEVKPFAQCSTESNQFASSEISVTWQFLPTGHAQSARPARPKITLQFPRLYIESRYVQTLLMKNELRSFPLRCAFILSSRKLSHCCTYCTWPGYLTGWLRLLQPGHKRYRKHTESCSINAISDTAIQQHMRTCPR